MDKDDAERTPSALGSVAEHSVKQSIARGRKRRLHSTPATQPCAQPINIARDAPVPLSSPVPTSQQLEPYKRRRTNLMSNDETIDEDSNDEWEEQVHIQSATLPEPIQPSAAHQNTARTPDKRPVSDLPDRGTASSQVSPAPVSQVDRKAQKRQKATLDRKKLLRTHSLHIALLVGHLQRLDTAAQDETIQALALSLAPEDFLRHDLPFFERLSRLALWATTTFSLTTMLQDFGTRSSHPASSRLCNVEDRIGRLVTTGKGDLFDALALVTALLRPRHMRCRIVSALQPTFPQRSKSVAGKEDASGQSNPICTDALLESQCVMFGWLEVWHSTDGEWRAVDLVDGSVCSSPPSKTIVRSAGQIRIASVPDGNPEKEVGCINKESRSSSRRKRSSARSKPVPASQREVRKSRSVSKRFFSHVVAVECGILTDVSLRYAETWTDIINGRANGNLFTKCLESLGRAPSSEAELMCQRLERNQFDEIYTNDVIPKTIAAVQKHPRYVLERHLKKYELIHPKQPVVGTIHNEPVYLRKNVHVLHTKDRWIRQMREVLDEEQASKTVASKTGSESTVDLFGEWQTKELQIEAVVGGRIPRGKHGNVDLWSEDHLPAGSAHVNHLFGRRAALRLGVDCAPAMTGFEVRRGRSVPRIEGIVVGLEFSQAVLETAKAMWTLTQDKQREKERMEALLRWNKLLRSMKAREVVRRKYGGLSDGRISEDGLPRAGSSVATASVQAGGSDVGLQGAKEGRLTAELPANGHVHEFDDGSCVGTETLWVKTCRQCGLQVNFEKL